MCVGKSSTMKCVLLLLAVACVHGAPAGGPPPSSCKDPATNSIAGLALEKINLDRTKGYILSLERLRNVQQTRHGETGAVYYLTMDVLETKCHVLSKKNWKDCENRNIGEHQVYGQCKAAIYINRPQRVVRLYKYSCNIRPVSASKIVIVCPDCPVMSSLDNEDMLKTMKMGMEKFNKESMLPNYFVPLELTRATMQGGFGIFRMVEFTIQETVCSNKTDVAEASKCEVMSCKFAHKGFCKASYSNVMNKENLNVNCDIYEPEGAEEEKQLHIQGAEGDHEHKNNVSATISHDHSHYHAHDHAGPHFHPPGHEHDHPPGHKHDHKHEGEHAHDHSGHHHHHDHKEGHGHAHPHDHKEGHGHAHPHDHKEGHGHAHPHEHGHDHSHDHSHDLDHVHAHHTLAHNHTDDHGVHPPHHNYQHADGETHEHDHELALDHEHKHGHLHEHEHHHHHHQHQHIAAKRKPEGTIRVHPALDKPTTLPFFPDPFEVPDRPTKIAPRPDPEIPGATEPVIGRFPTTVSPNCPAEFKTTEKLLLEAFAEDPLMNKKPAAGKP